MSPNESIDLTEIIERVESQYVVYWSPETAEDDPAYLELGRFASIKEAEAFLDAP
jgi:hypothetical protein